MRWKWLIPVAVTGGLWWGTGFVPPGNPSPFVGAKTSEKIAAITFDDGPSLQSTPLILNILQSHGAHATFFVTGEHAALYPSLLKQTAQQGNEIGNHSWNHPHLVFHGSAFAKNQIQRTSDIIETEIGVKPKFFRPPYGQLHFGILRLAKESGLMTVLWSDTGFDWLKPGTATIVRNVLNHLKPGAIILLHDGGGDRHQTVEALSQILSAGKSQGYRFVTLSQLKEQKIRDRSN